MASLTSVHDTNLVVWSLQALADGVLPGADLLQHLKRKIEERQTKWSLTEREAEHQRLIDMVLQELEVLDLYERGSKAVTDNGRELVRSIKESKGSRRPIIEYFVPRLLAQFEDVAAFLRFLDDRGEVRVPRVPGKRELGLEVGHRGRRKSEVETPESLRLYIDAVFDKIKAYLADPTVFKDRSEYWQANSRGKRHYDVVRTIVRDAALVDFKYGDVKYKVVRDRLWYVGIVNWSENLSEFAGEVCYPLYSKTQDQAPTVPFDSPIGTLFLQVPGRAEKPFSDFVKALWGCFKELSRKTVGYVAIPDLRDATCRRLRISDYAFNRRFVRFARACLQNEVNFSCNWETAELAEITPKRLPIDIPGLGIRIAVSINKS